MGGDDSPENIVRLTVEEHAQAHLELYRKYGNKFDYIAYLVLSKQIGQEEANYLKLIGPKNWSTEGKQRLSDLAKKRVGPLNAFYGKTHSEETKAVIREKMSGDNSWIKGIDPEKLPYTQKFVLTYPNRTTKEVYGLKSIATEFSTSIANVKATIDRIAAGKMPNKGIFKGMTIYRLERTNKDTL